MVLYEIEYFLAIAECHSLSKATDTLFVSQSALSQFLSKLEENLSCKLFYRAGKRLELTEAGKVFYAGALEIKKQKDHTLYEIKKIAARTTAEIRVGITGSRSLDFVSSLIPIMKEKYPTFAIHYSQSDVEIHCDNIRKHRIDCAFGTINYLHGRIDTRLFKEDEIGCYVSEKNHLHAKPENSILDLDELKNEDFVLLSQGSSLRHICDDYFSANHFTPNIYIECSQFNSLFDIVNNHNIVMLHSEAYHSRMPKAHFYRFRTPPHYELGIMYDSAHITSPCLEDFINLSIALKHTY